MKIALTEMHWFQDVLGRAEDELIHSLRTRSDIAIEPCSDQMDEIQCASERDLAIRNMDLESSRLRQVQAALSRLRDGRFGICVECESAISPKRLAAVPWAARCIQCQDAADREISEESVDSLETLVNAE
jgi:DnaK suppressor protein